MPGLALYGVLALLLLLLVTTLVLVLALLRRQSPLSRSAPPGGAAHTRSSEPVAADDTQLGSRPGEAAGGGTAARHAGSARSTALTPQLLPLDPASRERRVAEVPGGAPAHGWEPPTPQVGQELQLARLDLLGDAGAAALRAASAEARSLRERAALEADAVRRGAQDVLAAAAAARAEVEARDRLLRTEAAQRAADLERREERLLRREERLHADSDRLDDRARRLDETAETVQARAREADLLVEQRQQLLERTARLSADEAKVELVRSIEHDARREAVALARDIERTARESAEARAREVVTTAVQRLASEQTAEVTVTAVHLPSDDLKGRVIGREGRNIRAFEAVTGVNVIIDETPGAIQLSCFDPIRREVARVTLEALLADGRIHPQRIEETFLRSQGEVESLCRSAAEDALHDVGVVDLHPELVILLGHLRFRTSYGQNVLRHLVESAHVAGLMAAELGLDPAPCTRAALLHDIGKALTHEAQGSHAAVGADLARRCGEHPDVVHAIAAHHGEVAPVTVEAVLVQAADAVSGARPGARRESAEEYGTRMRRLEEIATAHEGVAKAYAMQGGREVRVMVVPEVVDDLEAHVLAHDIAKEVEHELTYPGQIRIVVVRESRSTELAR